MNSVNELTKLRYEWSNDLGNRELKLEEDREDIFLFHIFENKNSRQDW